MAGIRQKCQSFCPPTLRHRAVKRRLARGLSFNSVRPSVNWELKQKDKVVTSGFLEATTIIAEGERLLSFEYPEAASGEYQLTGELKWANDGASEKMPFAVDVIVP